MSGSSPALTGSKSFAVNKAVVSQHGAVFEKKKKIVRGQTASGGESFRQMKRHALVMCKCLFFFNGVKRTVWERRFEHFCNDIANDGPQAEAINAQFNEKTQKSIVWRNGKASLKM